MTAIPNAGAEAAAISAACPGATHTWSGLPCVILREPRPGLATVHFGGDSPAEVVWRSDLRRLAA